MKLGTISNPYKNIYGEVEWIGKNNFDFAEIAYDPHLLGKEANIDKLKKIIKKYNLSVMGHPPYVLPHDNPYSSVRQSALSEFIVCVRFFSKLNAEKIVIHARKPDLRVGWEKTLDWNLDSLNKLTDEAEKYNIKVLLENCSGSESTIKLIDEILKKNKKIFFHLDIGHSNLHTLKNTYKLFLEKFGKRLEHVHVSENDGSSDQHLPLESSKPDGWNWPEIVKNLKKYKYDKTITLEVFSPEKRYLLLSREKFLEWWKNA